MLAGRLGLGSSVRDALDGAFKRRDGRGLPNRRAGDEVPLPVRIATLARDIEVLTRAAAIDQIRQTVERRRGRAYDPQLVDVFCSHAEALLEPIDDRRVLDDVLDS